MLRDESFSLTIRVHHGSGYICSSEALGVVSEDINFFDDRVAMLVMVQLQLQKTSSVPVYVPGLFYTTQHGKYFV